LYVTSSGTLNMEPMDAFEFYLWVFQKNHPQPTWSDFVVTQRTGNKLLFNANYSLLRKKIKFEGEAVLSPERFIEFRINKSSASFMLADPALIRYALQSRQGDTLVTKTWHFMFKSKIRRTYEWLIAFQLKRHLKESFKADLKNAQTWSQERWNGTRLPVSA
jgi:hypothetical protein